jgi:hypothetical protein
MSATIKNRLQDVVEEVGLISASTFSGPIA